MSYIGTEAPNEETARKGEAQVETMFRRALRLSFCSVWPSSSPTTCLCPKDQKGLNSDAERRSLRPRLGLRVVCFVRRSDPYGCSEELSAKRNHRDPFARGVPYHARCSALRPLLNHCGPSIYLGRLPWNEEGGVVPFGDGGGGALGRKGGGNGAGTTTSITGGKKE